MDDEILVLNIYFASTGKLDRTKVLKYIQEWFSAFDHTIEQRSGKSGKIVSFTENKAFESFFSSTDSCAFYSGTSNSETELEMMDWKVFADINFNNEEVILSVNKSLISSDMLDLIKRFVNQLLKIASVYYAYSFTDKKVRAIGYAIRVIFYEMDGDFKKHNELAKKVAKWEAAVEEKNISEKFRNIYHVNIFSEKYFKFKISEMNVADWVKNTNHKQVHNMTEDLILWTVPLQNIPEVADQFIRESRIWEI